MILVGFGWWLGGHQGVAFGHGFLSASFQKQIPINSILENWYYSNSLPFLQLWYPIFAVYLTVKTGFTSSLFPHNFCFVIHLYWSYFCLWRRAFGFPVLLTMETNTSSLLSFNSSLYCFLLYWLHRFNLYLGVRVIH